MDDNFFESLNQEMKDDIMYSALDESIKIDLAKISPSVKEIDIVVTIHEAVARRQNFGMVRNSFMRIVDERSGKEIARYDLEEDFSTETAVSFGKIYFKDNE